MMIDSIRIRFDYKYLSRAEMAGIHLRAMLAKTSGYTDDQHHDGPNHEWGKGGSSTTVHTVRNDESQPVMIMIKIRQTYESTSDDFFDNAQSAEIELELLSNDARFLFDGLSAGVKNLARDPIQNELAFSKQPRLVALLFSI